MQYNVGTYLINMTRRLKFPILLFCFTFIYNAIFSQSPTENAGWVFITHTQNLSKKFKALADVQLRTGDKFIHFKTLLLRGALGYKINKEQSAALGYAYKNDWKEENGMLTHSPENRIYEQYLFEARIKRTQVSFRLRQEQRFVKETKDYQFSQRSRVFLSFQIPLAANADFSNGFYATIQNEVFLNTQHKEKVNNNLFDQNRPFISMGYRWSKKIDTEIGYMYWLQREDERDVSTNVFQLMFTTEL